VNIFAGFTLRLMFDHLTSTNVESLKVESGKTLFYDTASLDWPEACF